MNTRRATLIAGASLTAFLAAGCGNNGSTEGPRTVETPPTALETTTAALPPAAPGESGYVFGSPGPGGVEDNAFTYDVAAVPVGSSVDVESTEENGRTTVTLSARGLAANRDFGVHAHTRACGPRPSDSGPHYQNQVDPAATAEKPSTDPAYANPRNEVWLDITTDANGDAQASTTVDWVFRDNEAKSVVLHAHHTMTGPGQAGTAGDRLACVNEDF
ncbi:superoxide dismutase family protein [Rhodococcus sp. NPDC003322]